ncbi:chalcone isomerase family protein [Accumulibacter sp.]|uniref:chalcone isomerase family protein n=1 Tax=Accumulibacter sp. TaxID=2053492 RepID=UPI0025F48EC3|nr:chalcone isomerase family protein [Accumulibacter sp.]MCM8610938.1 chalcone isomerase family protein [Accumulibacter sp.]MCM8634758.1 chalcone isomerase family protein [Accumulibacter sp.]MCM8638312.1 chalcone isomerase family protein [Accumulibacter sp.]
MSSSSNLLINRRRLLLALAASPLAGLAMTGTATAAPTTGLRRWGSGEFRRFGLLIYAATLWASGDDPLQPPLALELTYKRTIKGRDIADASIGEMRKLGVAGEARLRAWGERMLAIFPDVRRGDRIVGVQLPEAARFYFNDRSIGSIDDPAFARAFFAIWLDAGTSAPDLRAALLTRLES